MLDCLAYIERLDLIMHLAKRQRLTDGKLEKVQSPRCYLLCLCSLAAYAVNVVSGPSRAGQV
jgi:hypothetical protein